MRERKQEESQAFVPQKILSACGHVDPYMEGCRGKSPMVAGDSHESKCIRSTSSLAQHICPSIS